jgi:hypothetical protein
MHLAMKSSLVGLRQFVGVAIGIVALPRGHALELGGYMLGLEEPRFVIADAAAKTHSAWLKVGESYGDYTIEKFDAFAETLLVRHGEEIITLPLKSSAVQPRSSANASDGETKRFWTLHQTAMKRFNDGNFFEAKRLAKESLEMAAKYPDRPPHGEITQFANTVLGRLALREGQVDEAIKFLIASGETEGGPGLNSFGPSMTLAKDLLEQGQSEAVLQYFDLCRKFWKGAGIFSGGNILDQWTADVKAGKMPKFSANLLYGTAR